jgi:hypothetical protein
MTTNNQEFLEITAGQLLRQRGLRLAVAESCTGGLIGHRLTNIPGSSDYYMGSVTAYAYEAKVRLLGVSWSTLEDVRSGQPGSGYRDGARSAHEPERGHRSLRHRNSWAGGRHP